MPPKKASSPVKPAPKGGAKQPTKTTTATTKKPPNTGKTGAVASKGPAVKKTGGAAVKGKPKGKEAVPPKVQISLGFISGFHGCKDASS